MTYRKVYIVNCIQCGELLFTSKDEQIAVHGKCLALGHDAWFTIS